MSNSRLKPKANAFPDYFLVYPEVLPTLIEQMYSWEKYDEKQAAAWVAAILDHGFKVSISQHSQTDRYNVALTDKMARTIHKGCVYMFEHDDWTKAVFAATFFVAHDLLNGRNVDAGDKYSW